MGQVNSLGTGGTFMADAKQFGLNGIEIAQAARTWFEAKVGSPFKTYYPFTQGRNSYKVELKYDSRNLSLSCMKIERT